MRRSFIRGSGVLLASTSGFQGLGVSVLLSNSLTDGPVSRVLWRFAFPIFCWNALQTLNGSLNAFWVGRYLGEVALSAVVNAHSVIILLTGASLGVTSAATIITGHYIGANNISEAKRVAGTGVCFFLVLSVVMSIGGVGLAEPLLIAMRTTDAALPLAVSYLQVMFLGLPSICMYAFVMSILFGSGDSSTPLRFMMLFVVIGALLDPLFIFGLGPVPGGGVAGSAFASVVAQTMSLGAMVSHLYRRRYPLCLYKKDVALLRMAWPIVRALVRKGIPLGAQSLVITLSHLFMIVFVNRFGDDTTAAFASSIQLWIYTQMPTIAISMAVSAMTAQNVGARNWDRVREVTQVGVIYTIVLTGVLVSLAYAFERSVYGLFLPEGSAAVAIASHINGIILWSLVFINISMVQFGVIRGYGAVMAPFIIYGIALLVVRYAVAISLIGTWQADALWWSFPVSNAVAFILTTCYYQYGNWRAAYRSLLPPSLPAHQRQRNGEQTIQ